MAVRMIKKAWWIDLRFNHTRYRKRSPENTKAGALAYEAVLRLKLARGEVLDLRIGPDNDDLTFEKFALRWFNQYVETNNKPSEQYAKEKILRASLVPFFGPLLLEEVTSERIEQYKARQVASGVSNKTINNRLTVLSKCLNCASEWHGLLMPRIKLLKCPPPRTDFLTSGECELLLDHANGELRLMILLALRTGMRQGEIRGLQWPSIDWQNRNLVVRHSWSDVKLNNRTLVSPKSNRERHIPLDAEVYRLLLENRKRSGFVFLSHHGEPFTCHRLIDELSKVCKRAKIRKIGWHVLRHTFATRLAERGVPLHHVQALLGHSTISTTMRYMHVTDSALRSAIDILNSKTVKNTDFGQPVGNQRHHTMMSEVIRIQE